MASQPTVAVGFLHGQDNGMSMAETVAAAPGSPMALYGGGESSSDSDDMSWLDSQDDTASAEAEPEAQAEPQTESGHADPAVQGADQREGFIPRSRFDEVNTRFRETQSRLEQLQAEATEYQQLAQFLRTQGLTETQLLQALQNPDSFRQAAPAQQQPTDTFEGWLQQQGLDPDYLDPATQVALQGAYSAQQVQQQLAVLEQRSQEAAQQAEHRANLSQISLDLQAVQEQYPVLKTPEIQDLLLNSYQMEYGTRPNRQAMQQHAQRIAAMLEGQIDTRFRNRLSEHATRAATDNARPNMAGGATPSPATKPDYARMNDQEWDAVLTDHLAGS